MAAVVDESVHRLLKHSLFVFDDDFRRIQLQKLFQTVVAVDHTAIKVVEIGGCKSAAVELHHRTDFRRNDRNCVENHPFRLVAGFAERLDHLETLDDAQLLLAACGVKLRFELLGKLFDVDFMEQLLDRLGSHADAEIVLVFLIHLMVFRLGQHLLFFKRRIAGIQHDILSEIDDLFEKPRRNIEKQSHTGRCRFKIPNVRHRSRKLDVSHPFAADLFRRHLDAALFTGLALVAHSFIFSARAFPVLGRPEDLLAEKTVALGAQGAVVDGLRLRHLAVRPASYHFRRCEPDLDRVKNIFTHLSLPLNYSSSKSASSSMPSSSNSSSESEKSSSISSSSTSV